MQPPPLMHQTTALMLPGLYNSGPDHWQSRWEQRDGSCRRLVQADWATPKCGDWAAVLDAAINAHEGPVVLVAHSSSNITVAYWARTATRMQIAKVHGALLVAPSDPDGPAYPAGPTGFSPMPLQRLPFPSIVVASSTDAYVTLKTASDYATAWGSEFISIGARGHINGESGLGDWPEGYALLSRLRGASTLGQLSS